jgi:hypothetical protein
MDDHTLPSLSFTVISRNLGALGSLFAGSGIKILLINGIKPSGNRGFRTTLADRESIAYKGGTVL